MDIIYSQSQKIFNSDKISSLQHAKKNDTVSVTHVSNIISHPKYTNQIGIALSHFPSNPSRNTITMWRVLRTLPCYAGMTQVHAQSIRTGNLAGNISESKLRMVVSAGEKYRRKVIGIRDVWNISGINGCISRIFSGLGYHNLDVKITVRWNGDAVPHANRHHHTYTCAHLTLCSRHTLKSRSLDD